MFVLIELNLQQIKYDFDYCLFICFIDLLRFLFEIKTLVYLFRNIKENRYQIKTLKRCNHVIQNGFFTK